MDRVHAGQAVVHHRVARLVVSGKAALVGGDHQVYVGRPDSKGREEILAVHTRNKPLARRPSGVPQRRSHR